jgi:Flp pilus assembly protein TadB
MIYVYVLGGIAAIIAILYAAVKIQSARADKFKVEAQAANETAKSAQIEIAQTNKTTEAVITVEKKLAVEQQDGQAKIDAGDRSFMSKETF